MTKGRKISSLAQLAATGTSQVPAPEVLNEFPLNGATWAVLRNFRILKRNDFFK